ncbi:hypothetical protein JCM3775_004032 [Rhodotorula graminis]|uniref:ATPase domain-containing protein n=1 Tax=Rhodotorula graminis (strain WP1) TaxID=578459 RepID=A0A0P9ETU2_RHOGW|nr:uncharacterized protein RHOBADRAFT_55719 [Rhodotorula graminis WP1]KPV72622.1 hypothetical protein RHOBADRAFT_55719 [Rhodotorula graminis WP1]
MKPTRQLLASPRALSRPRPTASCSCAGVTARASVGVAVRPPPLATPGARRTFFGIGEVLGVISNPSEVLRSLTESKKLLEEARQELRESQERSQIPPSHTFSPLPGFFDRPREIQAIERALGSVPTFTTLFGSSSVGKTALLRQVLSSDKYHVLNFDLRIAGFADLPSLYFSLSTQLESYFACIPKLLGEEWGWNEFEKEGWSFKHHRLEVQKRVENGGEVKTSDLAALLELFQSALLSYWAFEPMSAAQRKLKEQAEKEQSEGSSPSKDDKKERPSSLSGRTASSSSAGTKSKRDGTKFRTSLGAVPEPVPEKASGPDLIDSRSLGEVREGAAGEKEGEEGDKEDEPQPPPKRIPVFFLDEAHKLPALIQSPEGMKTLLDACLVLSKQDRLCHIMHATSDPFYLHWLRQMNVMQHCIILSVGDPSKDEARRFFEDNLLPHLREGLAPPVFDDLHKVFGTKLAHLSDYMAEYNNSDGQISPREGSHALQAHSLLNLQLIHSDAESASQGFKIYSPLRQASPHAAPSPFGDSDGADFKPIDLLRVMQRLQPGADDSLPYFPLCRKLGARAVDGMVRGRLLELRWSAAVTDETAPRADGRTMDRVVGPVVLPTTSVVRWAMGEVLKEYEAEGFTVEALEKVLERDKVEA